MLDLCLDGDLNLQAKLDCMYWKYYTWRAIQHRIGIYCNSGS